MPSCIIYPHVKRKCSHYLYIMYKMSIGGVKGGKRCRFYASDGDVKFEMDDSSTEYS